MLKNIKIDFDVLEMMIFYWESVKSKDKVVDSYMIEVADKPQMDPLYCEDFSKESVRKVLSAISNRELVNHPTKLESKFWNNNMWMLEDLSLMHNMMTPIKKLNLDHLKDEIGEDSKYDDINVIFIPGHQDTKYTNSNNLYINFFKMMAPWDDPETFKIEDKLFIEYVEDQIKDLVK